jgi:hypothetical protein
MKFAQKPPLGIHVMLSRSEASRPYQSKNTAFHINWEELFNLFYISVNQNTAGNVPINRRGRLIAPIADLSALIYINLRCQCHPIHFVHVTLSRSEGSLCMGVEMLRCGSA